MENYATVLGNENLHGERKVIEFSYLELAQATSDFNESNIIGKGGFGAVYRGKLRGIERAIKILHEQDDASQVKAYEHEVNILDRLEHPNLVHLIGASPETFAFVYEFMPETLEDRLVRKDLLWKDRLRIAAEVCTTLVYLHFHESVVHGDVKPANGLLDENGVSKLGGLGTCRLIPKFSTGDYATHVVGTPVYLDPTFLQSRSLAPSVDVYSFGMVLLRLLTKERAGDGLTPLVEDALEEQYLEDLLDDSANWPYQLAEQLCMLALRCCKYRPNRRPNTSEVLENLEQMIEEYLTS